MKRDEDLFAGLRPVAAPTDLEERVLEAARRAAAERPPRRPLEVRLWESRPLRWAWAATVVVLLAANAWYSAANGELERAARQAADPPVQSADFYELLPMRPPPATLAEQLLRLDRLLVDGQGDAS